MENESSKLKLLPIISSSQAVDKAIKKIEDGLIEEQTGLLCRWSKINQAVLGGFRFENQYLLAGLSGGGKSAMLNILRKDFADKRLNGKFKKKFRQLHLAFEMSSSDELIRTASSEFKMTYGEIISAERKISQEKFLELKAYLETLRDLEIDYIEIVGNRQQIKDTIMHYQALYPLDNLIISLDHTLLTDYLDEKDEIVLVSRLSKMFLQVRKDISSMNILIGQLNTEIEETKRIATPSQHFPIKRDIHGSKGVYQDADFVAVIHTPEKIGIQKYGRKGFETENKVFYHQLKARNADVAVICFENDYKHGNLIEL